ncbi:hypothetical protein FOZ63_022765 [Perkinsus olseni]|uniref:Amino acid transporter transmembrane domain-containing protein n=2 Tax=Perkinsus olseni TaxID=32597 RepID=A0A7J6SVN1_PEROL|nr:hypothetical protein FOZ63_022765 [Perkinsus olseni]
MTQSAGNRTGENIKAPLLPHLGQKKLGADSPFDNDSIVGGYSVLTKSMIGSGMLGMAYAGCQWGFVMGILACLVTAGITYFTVYVLAVMAMEYMSASNGELSFFNVAKFVSPKTSWLIDLGVAVKAFGASVAYIQIVGSLMAEVVLQGFSLGIDRQIVKYIVQIVLVVLLAPAVYCKSITSTKAVNMFGIANLAYLALLSIVYARPSWDNVTLWPLSVSGLFSRLPVFIFCFSCQQNLYKVCNELRYPTLGKLEKMGIWTVLSGLVIYTTVMIFPYMTFGENVDSNFLHNLPLESYPVKLGYIAASLSLGINLPLAMHPCRNSLTVLWYKGNVPSDPVKERRFRVMLTTLLLASITILGMAVDSLGIIMELAGLLGGNTMCYVMPTYLYCVMFTGQRDWSWYLSAFSFCFFMLLYPVCLISIIQQHFL